MQLELLEKLAEENLADAFLARISGDGGARLVTARRLQKQVTDLPGVVDALSDASAVMKSVEHENILPHVGFGEADGSYYWITERTDGFDLAMALNRLSSREVHINPVRSLQIGLDFLQGLQILHQREFLHGGLSPAYVLLGYDGVVRLDGIGFEKTLLGIKDLKKKSRRMRSDYLAPEVVQGRNPVPQSDVFSAAAILYTLLTGSPPMEKEGSGTNMSVRHSTIELPSKRDRTLPFSCDAIFIKALNTNPGQRHDSVDSFTAAVKRLRAAMLKGPDEERAGVKDFVENLFPNEAIVPGKPGSVDKPAMGAGLPLAMLQGKAPGAAPAPVPESREEKAQEPATPGKVDEAALARVAAWEAAFGTGGKPEEKKRQPPPLKGRPAPAAQPPPMPGDKKETPGPTSVVVDWMELGEEKESEDTEEIRPGKEPVVEEPADPEPPPAPPVFPPAEPEEEEPTPVRTEKIPTLVVEKEEEEEQTEPEKPTEEVLTGEASVEDEEVEEEEEKTAKEIEIPPDTIQMPQAAEPGTLPGKKVPWKIVAILAAVVVVAVLAFVFWPKDDDPARGDEAGASSIAFLSVHTNQPAKVTLDGELLVGETPLKDKVLRAGKHRVMVDSLDGTRLMDEVIVLTAGEHKDIRVVIAAAANVEKPPVEVKPDKPSGKKVRKKKKKKRVRRKRRRTRK